MCFGLHACKEVSDKNQTSIDGDVLDGVNAAFWNSEGSYISISTNKGELILTDSTLKVIKVKDLHNGNAYSSFFSLDDQKIITGGYDKLLNISDAHTLELIDQYDFGFSSFTSVYGYNTFGGCGENGKFAIYNKLTKDTIIQALEDEGAFHLYYISPDTSLVISSGISGYEFDILNKKISHIYKGHRDLVYCIMSNNNKDKVVTASKDSTVKIFNRWNEKNLYSSVKLDGEVYVACFSHNDDVVAASTSTGSIYFMDTTLSKVQMKIKAFDSRINTIHYSPCGTKILVGSKGNGAKIFSTVSGELLYEFDYSSIE